MHGVIAHLGPVKFSDKTDWVGVRLTTPSLNQGKNNGTVKEVFYFDAGGETNGCFVRAQQIAKREGMTRLEELKLKREIAQFKASITPKTRLELLKEKRAALASKQGRAKSEISSLTKTIAAMKDSRMKHTTNEAKHSASLNATISTLRRSLSASQEEASRSEECMERLAVELETARAEKEAREDEVEELKLDLETMELELEEAREGHGDAGEGTGGEEGEDEKGRLKKENGDMREALRKVRDTLRRRDREREEDKKKYEKEREEERKEWKTRMEDMHKQVDGREAEDEMVEGLTNRNLELEEEVENLAAVKRELEERVEVGEEMEEVMGEEINGLKKEAEGKDAKIGNLEEAVRRQRDRERDGEKEMVKYKELVRKLREEKRRMEEERRGMEGGEEKRENRERKTREEIIKWRKRENERENIMEELWKCRITAGGAQAEATKLDWVPRTVAAMEHASVSGDKTLALAAGALSHGLFALDSCWGRSGSPADDEEDLGGSGRGEKFRQDASVATALVDAHLECTRTMVAVGMGMGGGENGEEVSTASSHAFGEVWRMAGAVKDKIGRGERVAGGEVEMMREAVKHAREEINGDKDSGEGVEEGWNPAGWKQVGQAAKALWVCKALGGNFGGEKEIEKIKGEAERLVGAMKQDGVFEEGDGDELKEACEGLVEVMKESTISEAGTEMGRLMTAITKCLASIPKSPTSASMPEGLHPLLPSNLDAFTSCVKYVDSASSGDGDNAWARRREKVKARILEGDRCRTELGAVALELEDTKKALKGKEKEAVLLGKKISQLEGLLTSDVGAAAEEGKDTETTEKLRKEIAMLTEAMEVLHTQVDEYESEIRSMKGGRGRERSPKKGKGGASAGADGDRDATARAADATRPALRAAARDARNWRCKAIRSMAATIKPLGRRGRRTGVAQPQGGDVLEARRAEGEGGRNVRELLVKACCDARVAKAKFRVIEVGKGRKTAAEMVGEAERECREANKRIEEAVEECRWALRKGVQVKTGGGKKGAEDEVLRARVRIQRKGTTAPSLESAVTTRRHLLGGESELERLLVWSQRTLMA
ncbi:hypothetical protein TrRE_jg13633 [Triparma retinervis]|uniref:CAP-Gly domain-containing protein n=1 Tax=Triparma retinervis TaxID=2557542 RepID=A0A9W7DZW6_9STRA|nr:hypothetical protein TrRE_jg13633 [Triparma retinervis]